MSLTERQAARVARKNTDPFFAYDANYLIDNKARIIVDAEGTRANRVVEIAVTRTMPDRVGRRFQGRILFVVARAADIRGGGQRIGSRSKARPHRRKAEEDWAARDGRARAVGNNRLR
jgi:hypothetical protein